MAEVESISEINVKPEEIRVDIPWSWRTLENQTESLFRITHLPTGIVAECQDDRSQHEDKNKALKVLCARIKDQELANNEVHSKHVKHTNGSGDRSERFAHIISPRVGLRTIEQISLHINWTGFLKVYLTSSPICYWHNTSRKIVDGGLGV